MLVASLALLAVDPWGVGLPSLQYGDAKEAPEGEQAVGEDQLLQMARAASHPEEMSRGDLAQAGGGLNAMSTQLIQQRRQPSRGGRAMGNGAAHSNRQHGPMQPRNNHGSRAQGDSVLSREMEKVDAYVKTQHNGVVTGIPRHASSGGGQRTDHRAMATRDADARVPARHDEESKGWQATRNADARVPARHDEESKGWQRYGQMNDRGRHPAPRVRQAPRRRMPASPNADEFGEHDRSRTQRHVRTKSPRYSMSVGEAEFRVQPPPAEEQRAEKPADGPDGVASNKAEAGAGSKAEAPKEKPHYENAGGKDHEPPPLGTMNHPWPGDDGADQPNDVDNTYADLRVQPPPAEEQRAEKPADGPDAVAANKAVGAEAGAESEAEAPKEKPHYENAGGKDHEPPPLGTMNHPWPGDDVADKQENADVLDASAHTSTSNASLETSGMDMIVKEAQAADAALAELTAGARNVSIANVSGAAFARDDVAPVALDETKRSSSQANTGVFAGAAPVAAEKLAPEEPAPSCPRCGQHNEATPNCCSIGGAWEGRCDEGGTHTWHDGYRACLGVAVAPSPVASPSPAAASDEPVASPSPSAIVPSPGPQSIGGAQPFGNDGAAPTFMFDGGKWKQEGSGAERAPDQSAAGPGPGQVHSHNASASRLAVNLKQTVQAAPKPWYQRFGPFRE